MLVKFWGVRGSIPSPGPKTVRYGGNTSCFEVQADNGDFIILEAGTGIRELALSLLGKMPISTALFLTHMHWDHIQGFPFFIPLFIPGNSIDIYGPVALHEKESLEEILSIQMRHVFFPVRIQELNATLNYHQLADNLDPIQVGAFKVTPIPSNHPVTTLGYLIEADGKKVFYSGDMEPYNNPYKESDKNSLLSDEFQMDELDEMAKQQNQIHINKFKDIDLLIHDAAYTEEEYHNGRVGWGHSPIEWVMDIAMGAKVKNCVLYHHEPTRTDEQIDSLLVNCKKYIKESKSSLNIVFAKEGEDIQL